MARPWTPTGPSTGCTHCDCGLLQDRGEHEVGVKPGCVKGGGGGTLPAVKGVHAHASHPDNPGVLGRTQRAGAAQHSGAPPACGGLGPGSPRLKQEGSPRRSEENCLCSKPWKAAGAPNASIAPLKQELTSSFIRTTPARSTLSTPQVRLGIPTPRPPGGTCLRRETVRRLLNLVYDLRVVSGRQTRPPAAPAATAPETRGHAASSWPYTTSPTPQMHIKCPGSCPHGDTALVPTWVPCC